MTGRVRGGVDSRAREEVGEENPYSKPLDAKGKWTGIHGKLSGPKGSREDSFGGQKRYSRGGKSKETSSAASQRGRGMRRDNFRDFGVL